MTSGDGGLDRRGVILVMVLALMILLTSLVGGFLYAASVFVANSGWEETDAQLLALAEAGLHKAVWNLKTPTSGVGQGEDWTTSGTTESLGDGTYTMVVERWDFALASNGATASDDPQQADSSTGPDKAIDGSDSTYWESKDKPTPANPQDLIVAFPYPWVVNKVHFLSPSSGSLPKDYEWAVSTDGSTFTTVVSATDNGDTDVTDVFSAQSDVTHVRLRTTKDGEGNPQRVRISTLGVIGSRVTSTGRITATGQTYTRVIRQTLAADDGSPENQKAYVQPDWAEL